MSLKSIEMQIALPRTQDAGKLQEQLQGRGQLQNDLAASSVQKEEELKRKTVTKQEQKDEVKWNQESDKNNHQSPDDQQTEGQKECKEKAQHPYKGKFIDVSG